VLFLHSYEVEAESILSCDFMTLRKVIDFLVFVEALVQVALAAAGAPQDVPFMALGRSESSCFKYGSRQLVVEPKHLEEELTALNMMTPLVPIELHRVFDHLLFSDILKHQKVCLVFVAIVFCLSQGRARAIEAL
jgi:hypothetical protein